MMEAILVNIFWFFLGVLLATLFAWQIHRRQQQAWQSEYRRLMGGIKKAFTDLHTLTCDDVTVMNQPKSSDIGLDLLKLYQGLI